MTDDKMRETIEDYYPAALRYADLESFGGRYDSKELKTLFAPNEVKQEVLALILSTLRKGTISTSREA